jgi:hypothetical protein
MEHLAKQSMFLPEKLIQATLNERERASRRFIAI